MEIEHKKTAKNGQFFLNVNGVKKAQMTYTYAGTEKFIIDHTEVDESIKGQGVGYSLVEASVVYARSNNLKIMPLCPFAKAVFNKRSEYQDVLF